MYKQIILLVIFFLLSGNIQAVSLSSFNKQTASSFEYTIEPEIPKPNEITKISLSAYNFNINSAEILYYINDNLVQTGIGKKEFIFQAPDSGVKMNIKIFVKDDNNNIYVENIFIQPIDATLVYEVVDSYKPPFYKGKAYVLSNSEVKFKAFSDFVNAEGKYINEDELIYTWYINYKIQNKESGYGKKFFTISRLDAFPIKTKIEVLITDREKTNQVRTALILKPEETVTDFYSGNSAEPFKYKNILKNDTFEFSGLSGNIIAVPYFMDGILDSHKPVFYNWRLNGQRILKSRNTNRNLIYIAANQDSDLKTATVSLDIENKVRPLQSYSGEFTVKFNKNDNFDSKRNRVNFNQSENSKIKEDDNGFFGLF